MNPNGFAYTGDFSVMGTDSAPGEPDDFDNEYAKVNGEEDWAMIFRVLVTRDKAWLIRTTE